MTKFLLTAPEGVTLNIGALAFSWLLWLLLKQVSRLLCHTPCPFIVVFGRCSQRAVVLVSSKTTNRFSSWSNSALCCFAEAASTVQEYFFIFFWKNIFLKWISATKLSGQIFIYLTEVEIGNGWYKHWNICIIKKSFVSVKIPYWFVTDRFSNSQKANKGHFNYAFSPKNSTFIVTSGACMKRFV